MSDIRKAFGDRIAALPPAEALEQAAANVLEDKRIGAIVYSERRIQEERDRWDRDDRKVCICGCKQATATGTCIALTRHPSGRCTDCRTDIARA